MPFGITICSVNWVTSKLELAEVVYPYIVFNFRHRTIGIAEDAHFAIKFNHPIGTLFGDTVNTIIEKLMPYVSLAADGYEELYKEDGSFDCCHFDDSAREALNTINAILAEYQQDEICRIDAGEYYKGKLDLLSRDLSNIGIDDIYIRDQGDGRQETPYIVGLYDYLSNFADFQEEFKDLCKA